MRKKKRKLQEASACTKSQKPLAALCSQPPANTGRANIYVRTETKRKTCMSRKGKMKLRAAPSYTVYQLPLEELFWTPLPNARKYRQYRHQERGGRGRVGLVSRHHVDVYYKRRRKMVSSQANNISLLAQGCSGIVLEFSSLTA